MPRTGQGWPEIFPVGSGENPVPKPTVNKEARRRTMREMYAGKRYGMLSGYAVGLSTKANERLRAWIEGFMIDDWGKTK